MATEPTREDYEALLTRETKLRASEELKNNPNYTIKDVLSPEEIQKLSIVRNDDIYSYFNENYDNNLLQDYEENIV